MTSAFQRDIRQSNSSLHVECQTGHWPVNITISRAPELILLYMERKSEGKQMVKNDQVVMDLHEHELRGS